MRKFLIFLVSLSIVALLVVGFKSYTLYYYNTNNIDISNKTYLIRKNSKEKTNINIEKLNMFLDPEVYTTKDNGLSYEKVIGSGKINITVIHNIIQNTCYEDNKLLLVDYVDLMKYSKIDDEIGLIDYYIKNKDKELNIINFIYEIKTKYLANRFVDKLGINGIISILSKENGYIKEEDNLITLNMFNDGNQYKIEFNDITLDEVKEIMSTIEFK